MFVASLMTGGVPASLWTHPNRKLGLFQFHVTDDGAPVPAWSSWTSVLFPLTLGYLDLGTDISAVVSYYQAGRMWWFVVGLAIIVGPTLFAAIFYFRNEQLGNRVCVALHLGLLCEAYFSLRISSMTQVLVSLRVVEALYESTPQLMLQTYALLLDWGNEGAHWPIWRIFSVATSCSSLAYATTSLVAVHPLSSLCPTAVEGSQGEDDSADRLAAQRIQSGSSRFAEGKAAVVTDGTADRAGVMPRLRYEDDHEGEGGTGIATTVGVDVSSGRCPCPTGQLFRWMSGKVFDTVPADGSVQVFRSRWRPRNFMWAFLLYQWLEIGSRLLSLALLALVLRAYFFLVLLWFWVSRAFILYMSLGRGEQLWFRAQIRLVGMPFMDSVMDELASYDAACALTTVEFVACVTVSYFFYTSEADQVPDRARLVSIYVAVGLMTGKLFFGFLIVRPFKRVVGFGSGLGEKQQDRTDHIQYRNRADVGSRDVESGGSSRGGVRELRGPERRRGVHGQGSASFKMGERGTSFFAREDSECW